MTDEAKIEKLLLLFYKQRKARDTGELNNSSEYLKEIETELISLDEEDALRHWSRYFYEKASVHKLSGDAKRSIDAFQKSSEFAQKNNNSANALNGVYHMHLMRYLSGGSHPEEAYKHFLDVEKAIRTLENDPKSDKGALALMHQNLLTRLCDLSFEVKSSDFSRWKAQYSEDPQTEQYRYQLAPRFLLANLRNDGRSAYLDGAYDEAAAIFSSYLSIDRAMAFPSPDIENLVGITEFVRDIAEETARDYRDAGRCIVRSTFSDAHKAAAHIWAIGCELPDAIGNRRYLADMRDELNALETGSD